MSTRTLTWLNGNLQGLIGVATVVLGIVVIGENVQGLLGG